MPTYDAESFDPHALVARVTLRNPANGAVLSEIPLLLDSGADVTLIPQAYVEALGVAAIPDKYYELAGFDGNTSFAPVVQLELVFLGRTFKGQFLLINRQWGVMGRNILNVLAIMLDGPRLTWNEQPARQ